MTLYPARFVAVVVAVIALVGATILVVADGDDEQPPATTATTVTTASPPSTASTVVEDDTAIWPFPGDAAFDTGVMAAQSFAVEFLGFTDPVVGELQQGDSRSGEVEIRPTPGGPVTTVFVRQLSGEDTWSVLGSATAGIELGDPDALATITSPVRVAGRALAFEGTVQVEVREDGSTEPLGAGFVTGGGDVLRPFEGLIAFRAPTATHGSVVLFTRSEEDGRLWEAASIRVALSTSDDSTVACGPLAAPAAAPDADEMIVTVYFTCGDDLGPLVAVPRVVAQSSGLLRASLAALLAGPTADERDAGVTSWFSDETASLLRSVNLRDGHAVVDFADLRTVIPNASASAGSALLLAQLDATVFQFDGVGTAEYRLDGSCVDFNEWLQLGGCDARTRPTDV